MAIRISVSSRKRAIHSISSLVVLLILTFPGAHWPTLASANPHPSPPFNGKTTRSSGFDADANDANQDALCVVHHECSSLATARWLPHSTVNIGYARGDFTDSEQSVFHQAVTKWQQALALTKADIVLLELGEIDKTAELSYSQIIVERDDSMDAGHNGKFMASVRPDNYVQQALILIKGSIHKRDTLKKTLQHELGHAFGLRDCPDCRSGATVMNYFTQRSVMGFKIGNGSTKISDHPTAGDISQVARGYLQSLPPLISTGPNEPPENTRTMVADEEANLTYGKSPDTNDDIVAPYLRTKRASYGDSGARDSKASFQMETNPPASFLEIASGSQPGLLALANHLQPEWKKEISTLSVASFLPLASAGMTTHPVGVALSSAAPRQAYASAYAPILKPDSATYAPQASTPLPLLRLVSKRDLNVLAIGPRARDESVLTDHEKLEFESYLPTLLGREAETMEQLKNYTFRRDVLIQTIDNKGRVSGEYHRISDLLFDDSGGRIERGLSSSKSTLRRLKISPEYIEDFSGAQLKGFELARRDHYRIEPFMADTIDGIRMRVYRITPLSLNAERSLTERVFYGFAWVDENTGKIVKIKGCALPDDKQRYPIFETERELVDGTHLFPVRTSADDYLVFPSHTVHIRMVITYTNYKKFASKVNITEVDGGS